MQIVWVENLLSQVYLDPGVKVKVNVTLWDQTITFTHIIQPSSYI